MLSHFRRNNIADFMDNLPRAILTLSEDYVQMKKDLAKVTKQVQVLTQLLNKSQHVERTPLPGSKRIREVEVEASEHEGAAGAGKFIEASHHCYKTSYHLTSY